MFYMVVSGLQHWLQGLEIFSTSWVNTHHAKFAVVCKKYFQCDSTTNPKSWFSHMEQLMRQSNLHPPTGHSRHQVREHPIIVLLVCTWCAEWSHYSFVFVFLNASVKTWFRSYCLCPSNNRVSGRYKLRRASLYNFQFNFGKHINMWRRAPSVTYQGFIILK